MCKPTPHFCNFRTVKIFFDRAVIIPFQSEPPLLMRPSPKAKRQPTKKRQFNENIYPLPRAVELFLKCAKPRLTNRARGCYCGRQRDQKPRPSAMCDFLGVGVRFACAEMAFDVMVQIPSFRKQSIPFPAPFRCSCPLVHRAQFQHALLSQNERHPHTPLAAVQQKESNNKNSGWIEAGGLRCCTASCISLVNFASHIQDLLLRRCYFSL